MRAKKVIAGLLAVSALFGTNFVTLSSGVSELVLTASALAPQAWGGNATYTVDNATGTVTVEGEGALSGAPLQNDISIKKVIISEGITSISDNAFYGCAGLVEVKIAFYILGFDPSTGNEKHIFSAENTITENTETGEYTGHGESGESLTSKECKVKLAEYLPLMTEETKITTPYALTDLSPFDAWQTENEPADVNGDTIINASDATIILITASKIGTSEETGLTEAQENAADVNQDGKIDASDAAVILQYAADIGSGKTVTLQEYIK